MACPQCPQCTHLSSDDDFMPILEMSHSHPIRFPRAVRGRSSKRMPVLTVRASSRHAVANELSLHWRGLAIAAFKLNQRSRWQYHDCSYTPTSYRYVMFAIGGWHMDRARTLAHQQ